MVRIPPLAARLLGLPLVIALGSTALAAEGGAVAIKRGDCERLVKHVPAPDVDYRPGVDAQGRPVVPADLDGGHQLVLPETVRIPITVLLQDRFGIPANSVLYEAEAEIGTAEVSLDGERVTFGGQELGDAEMRALAAACRQILNPD